MKLDIELPEDWLPPLKKMIPVFLILVVLTGLALFGKAVSPVQGEGKPILLTPRRAQILSYQRDAKRWAADLNAIQADLAELLPGPAGPLLEMDQRVNLLYERLVDLQTEVDGRSVPGTLDAFHASIRDAVRASLDAALQVAAWISEPTPGALQAAENALAAAADLLAGMDQNPWLQAVP
jgi:hypothetical protein